MGFLSQIYSFGVLGRAPVALLCLPIYLGKANSKVRKVLASLTSVCSWRIRIKITV